MTKKMLSLFLCALLLLGLAACGGDASSVVSSMPAITLPESTPEPEPEPLNQAFLTGLEKGADYPEGQRICGVMVNNIAGSRPTRGLSEAKIVYEIKVEGGITRFMAVYEDYKTMPTVGSVRSARDQFFQLLLPFWGFYLHDGPNQNQPVLSMIRENDYEEFDLTPDYTGGLTWRDSRGGGFPSEYTEYTDGEHIADYVERHELDDARTYGSPIFSFTPYNEEPRVLEGGAAPSVAVVHSAGYRNLFEYNEGDGRYMMSQFSSRGLAPAIDENNNEQLGFDNLLVLFAPMSLYNNSELVKVNYSGGIGFYFNGGKYEVVRWKKGGPTEPLRIWINDDTETACQINPGTTYVGIVDLNLLEDFDASVKAGNAESTAAAGSHNPNETDADD